MDADNSKDITFDSTFGVYLGRELYVQTLSALLCTTEGNTTVIKDELLLLMKHMNMTGSV